MAAVTAVRTDAGLPSPSEHQHHARRSDAGRAIEREQLAGLVGQVAGLAGIGDQGGERVLGGAGSGSDEHDEDVGFLGGSLGDGEGLELKVHNPFFPSTMLFHSSIRKELSRSFGATLVVLVTIVMTMMLIRTLGLASKGSVNPSEVFLVMTYTVLGYMPTILSLCLFIAIVGTLSRMYRDSEMVIWFSSGRGLVDFLRPLFGFAWPILLLVALFALVGWPWANSQTDGMRQRYESRSDIERVAPGEFRESAGRLRVFFIDKDAPDSSTANNIFISSIERNLHIITSARQWPHGRHRRRSASCC